MNDEDIARYYDEFAAHQSAAAFNERHRFLYGVLRGEGLSRDSRVLELGCGIGVMTALIARTVKVGRILAVDISPTSVALARRAVHGASAQIDVTVGDARKFRADSGGFDFVTLLDVLEHIPLETHTEVFETIAAHTDPGTKIIINIPNPSYNEYLRQYEPQALQIIDEVVPADHILRLAYGSGLTLLRFLTYGIWNEDEYQVMTFRRRQPFEKRPIVMGHAERLREEHRRFWQRVIRFARRSLLGDKAIAQAADVTT